MFVIWALLEQKIKIIKIGLIWTKSTTNHCDGECWCDYWGGKIGTNLINLEFWFLVSFTRSESRPAEQAPSPPRKGLNDFRAGGDSGTAGTGCRGRLWFEAQSRTNPWWIERELLSFCEIGLNYSEQAELIEQFLVGSWFLWLFGIGPFFGDDWGNLLFSGPLNLGSPFEDLILSWNRFLNRKV